MVIVVLIVSVSRTNDNILSEIGVGVKVGAAVVWVVDIARSS